MSVARAPRIDVQALRAALDVAPDAMLGVDAVGRVVLANARAETMFGRAAPDLCNLPLDALLPPSRSDANVFAAPDGSPSMCVWPTAIGDERAGRRHDGQLFPAETAMRRVATEDGDLTLVSVRDVSTTLRVRQAAERARHDTFGAQISRLVLESLDYESAIQQTPGLVAAALQVPAAAILSSGRERRAFRIRAASGLSTTTAEVLTAIFEDEQFVHRAFGDTGRDPATLETLGAEAATVVRDGLARTRYPNFAFVPLFGRYEPLGILIALAPAADAFDREKVGFMQAIANLLTATVQRSHAEEQLAHAQRLDAVGQLTGGIAHDFNNLLTVVSGSLQLLEMELPQKAHVQEVIDGALRAVDRGAQLTRKLLTFARRQSLQPRAVRPAPLLREMGRMLTRTLGEAVTVHIQCATGVPPVYADPAELETALVNLAVNARDAMPRGGRLTIAAEATAIDEAEHDRSVAPGRYVAFKVADTGSGMSPDVRARAVEPFFTTKGAGKGSGLGLSMVYGFVTQSGGCVDVDSQLGYGTRVTFLLPVARDAAPMPREHVASAAPARSATVLVVEDEAEVRNIAAAFLRDLGYEVLTAAGALSALQELASQPHVDLLFTDVVLGDTMSGVELAHEARRLYPGLAVLLVSGYSGVDSDPRHVDTAAQFPLLRKPYRREQLADAVRAVLHDS